MAVTIDGTNGINDIVLGSSTPAAATVTTFTSNGIDDNADAVAITVESSSGGDLGHGSKPVIAQDEGGIFFCDGTSWYGYTLKALT